MFACPVEGLDGRGICSCRSFPRAVWRTFVLLPGEAKEGLPDAPAAAGEDLRR